MKDDAIEAELERQLEALGYELVDLERAGSRSRPILRIRIDRPDTRPGAGVTVDECATVSRTLETALEQGSLVGDRYVLEVSSPGVERPLRRPRDFERFAGEEVAVIGTKEIGPQGKRIEGTLLGLTEDGQVRLRTGDGRTLDIPRASIARSHLIFRWRS
jgi:ribosome maturation factor RimP